MTLQQPAYVLADQLGTCLYATDAALELLGTDSTSIRSLRIGDLSPLHEPDPLRAPLEASETRVGTWVTGAMDLRRSDGSVRRARVAVLRRVSGELVARFEPNHADIDEDLQDHSAVRDVLEAWRRQEQALPDHPPGTAERLVAEAEIDWLSAEYQRLVIARGQAFGSDQ